jgi:hypothetical protein
LSQIDKGESINFLAWELLIKAKCAVDHSENPQSLYLVEDDVKGKLLFKTNRSGNPLSYWLVVSSSETCERQEDSIIYAKL